MVVKGGGLGGWLLDYQKLRLTQPSSSARLEAGAELGNDFECILD